MKICSVNVDDMTVKIFLEEIHQLTLAKMGDIRDALEKIKGERLIMNLAYEEGICAVGEIENFFLTLRKALIPIPKGVSAAELFKHPDVIQRNEARTKLQNSRVFLLEQEEKTSLLLKLLDLFKNALDLLKNPTIDNSKMEIDEGDHKLLIDNLYIPEEKLKADTILYAFGDFKGHGSTLTFFKENNLFKKTEVNLEMIKSVENILEYVALLKKHFNQHLLDGEKLNVLTASLAYQYKT